MFKMGGLFPCMNAAGRVNRPWGRVLHFTIGANDPVLSRANALSGRFLQFNAARRINHILAHKLTSHACALWVCSPPAAIVVTPAISQTSICKALGIDSPSQAQMNKHRHKTWSFCFKYCILSMSSKIVRQMGGIFQLWQFLLDQIAHGRLPGIKKWRHVNKWKPWSFQLHCAVKPYFSFAKWKMYLLTAW